MGSDIAHRQTLRSLAPSRGRIRLALLGALGGTTAYLLFPQLSWREDIPTLAALVTIGLYVGLLAAEQINTLVTNRLEAAMASVDTETMRLRLRSMEERFPRRSILYRWCVIGVAGSYFLVILVGIPFLIAALAVWGLGSAVGIDATVLAWVRQTGVIIAVLAIMIGVICGTLGFRRALRLHRSMRTGAEFGDYSLMNKRSVVVIESELSQLIPRGLIHGRRNGPRSTVAVG